MSMLRTEIQGSARQIGMSQTHYQQVLLHAAAIAATLARRPAAKLVSDRRADLGELDLYDYRNFDLAN